MSVRAQMVYRRTGEILQLGNRKDLLVGQRKALGAVDSHPRDLRRSQRRITQVAIDSHRAEHVGIAGWAVRHHCRLAVGALGRSLDHARVIPSGPPTGTAKARTIAQLRIAGSGAGTFCGDIIHVG
jgi:hypothetical protein